jgi:hypothetical protein
MSPYIVMPIDEALQGITTALMLGAAWGITVRRAKNAVREHRAARRHADQLLERWREDLNR